MIPARINEPIKHLVKSVNMRMHYVTLVSVQKKQALFKSYDVSAQCAFDIPSAF